MEAITNQDPLFLNWTGEDGQEAYSGKKDLQLEPGFDQAEVPENCSSGYLNKINNIK